MTLPRPALLAILGGVLILAVFALTRAVGQAEEPSEPLPAPAADAAGAQASGSASHAEQPPARTANEREKPAVPAGLERALARGKVAVVAFTQGGGAEDDAVRAAVRSLDGVPVFVDDVRDVADYRLIVGRLELDRVPAVVIVRADGKAEVIEGYVDPGSLAQQVEDAR